MKVGAQLFTIRESCKTLEDFSESLKKIADIGYKYVQVSGTCAYSAEWLDNELKKNGLKCVLTHIGPEKLLNDLDTVIKEHDIFDCKNVGLGSYAFFEENIEECVDNFTRDYLPVVKKLATNGKYFMYHNHAKEFIKFKDKTVLEHIAEIFEKDELGFTLDTYWVQAGGGNPEEWIRRLSGRLPVIHLKDYSFGPKMAVLGEGNLNIDKIIEAARDAGTEYLVVEQDDCNGEDPFECLKRSYEFLKLRGFE